jgi:hypothetical protein
MLTSNSLSRSYLVVPSVRDIHTIATGRVFATVLAYNLAICETRNLVFHLDAGADILYELT